MFFFFKYFKCLVYFNIYMLRTLFTFNNVKMFIDKFVLFKKQIQLRTNLKRIFDLQFPKVIIYKKRASLYNNKTQFM